MKQILNGRTARLNRAKVALKSSQIKKKRSKVRGLNRAKVALK